MRRRPWIIAGSAFAALVLAGFATWWFVLRSDAPPEVNLEDAVAAVTTTAAPTTTTVPTTTPAVAGSTTTTSTTVPTTTTVGGLDGSWTLDDSGVSFVGYRVEEELARIGFTEAVGRTTAVSGMLGLSGTSITTVTVDADMTALQSDSRNRDNAIRNQALETSRFPTASFALTSPIELGALPEPETVIEATATGDLTIHGVTNQVEIPLQAQLVEGVIVVVGSLPVQFADYDIDTPRAAVVLSIEDNGVMEFQLVFRR